MSQNRAGTDYIGVGVGAVIVSDRNEILLLLRSNNSRNEPGKWCPPGGEVEFGERLEQAVKREVKEEIGCEVEVERLLKIVDHIISGEKQHWCNPIFKARIVKGKPENKEKEKIEKLQWFPANKLPKNITTNLADLFEDIKEGKILL